MAQESKVAAAIGVSANSSLGGPAGKARASRIEKAMRKAIKKASEEGLQVDKDAAVIKERMMAARQKILDQET